MHNESVIIIKLWWSFIKKCIFKYVFPEIISIVLFYGIYLFLWKLSWKGWSHISITDQNDNDANGPKS